MDSHDVDSAPRKDRSTLVLVLGIVGMVAWIIPLFGLPVTICGLVYGIQEVKVSNKGSVVTGLILSGIGLVLTIINAAWGAYLGATGQHPLIN